MKRTWENQVKNEIRNNFFYFLQCPHCETIFLIEESIDLANRYTHENPLFDATCPRCETKVKQVSVRRLKLQLVGIAKEDEVDPMTRALAERLKERIKTEEPWSNPKFASFLDEVQEKKTVVSCRQLMVMIEKARKFRDDVEWKTEIGWTLTDVIHRQLLDELQKRCPEVWKKYAKKWASKYAREMEEALEFRKTELNSRARR